MMTEEYKKWCHEAELAYQTDPRNKYMTLTEFMMAFIDDRFIEEEAKA